MTPTSRKLNIGSVARRLNTEHPLWGALRRCASSRARLLQAMDADGPISVCSDVRKRDEAIPIALAKESGHNLIGRRFGLCGQLA